MSLFIFILFYSMQMPVDVSNMAAYSISCWENNAKVYQYHFHGGPDLFSSEDSHEHNGKWSIWMNNFFW